MKKRWLSIVSLILAVSLLAGCSAQGSATTAAATEAAQTTAAETTQAETDQTETTQAETEGTTELESEETDVVVIGAGGAGLTAAYFAREGGKEVILLEKQAMTGGNTAQAGFFAANSTHMQEEFGVTYTQEDQYDFVMETPGVDPDFARLFVENSGPTAEGVVDTLGIEVTSVTGREIYSVDEDGRKLPNQMVSKLTEVNEEMGVDIRLQSPATALIMEDGRVTGVTVEGPDGAYNIMADAVIIASGGFAANKEMIAEYAPDWVDAPTSNTSATTGDGILMAEAIGAATSNMTEFTFNPTLYDNNGVAMSVSGVRYEGGILVTYEGERFTDEMANYSDVAYAEVEKADGKAWAIMDANSLACNPNYAVSADTIEELAELINIDPDVLSQTIADYQAGYDSGEDEFGRTDMRSRLDEAPYYAVPVIPGVHHTRGGLSIDLDGRVLDTNGDAIPGLYAAGEVTDNKLLGNDPVAVGVTFGRLTAQTVLNDLSEE